MNFYCIAEDKLKFFVLVCLLGFSRSCKSDFRFTILDFRLVAQIGPKGSTFA